jgi:hypothetical protein
MTELCECTVQYTITREIVDGKIRKVYRATEPLPLLEIMCYGTCASCGKPYHDDFKRLEPRQSFD